MSACARPTRFSHEFFFAVPSENKGAPYRINPKLPEDLTLDDLRNRLLPGAPLGTGESLIVITREVTDQLELI